MLSFFGRDLKLTLWQKQQLRMINGVHDHCRILPHGSQNGRTSTAHSGVYHQATEHDNVLECNARRVIPSAQNHCQCEGPALCIRIDIWQRNPCTME